MVRTGLFLEPIWQEEQGLDGLHHRDLLFSLGNGTACELEIGNYRAQQDDALWILQLLEGPRCEADLDECLSCDLYPAPLLDTNAHHQIEHRKSGGRGPRKRRISPWDPMFFGKWGNDKYIRRKNNSRWTAEEVKILVAGVSEFGVGPWTKLKKKYFKSSIRTAVNLKDKWRNLLQSYQGHLQKKTLLYLDPPLVEQIRDLAVKHPHPKRKYK
ncbi:hypothetical protein U9M48_009313 [Paspalum notatum var. saurae]|uniref:Myb-like domain-containing protein n=1 Tax=Paspalum notatum var. saurae TaxID=547442 RepID=A0AAQ3SQR9_PASNO